jgi:hypothetical protein
MYMPLDRLERAEREQIYTFPTQLIMCKIGGGGGGFYLMV